MVSLMSLIYFIFYYVRNGRRCCKFSVRDGLDDVMMAMSLIVISPSIHEHDCLDCYGHDNLDDRDIRGVYK